jgi:hypothetical protein
MVLMAGLGGSVFRPLIRSIGSGGNLSGILQRQTTSTFVHVSVRTRVGVATGIVYLMVAKPDLLEAVAVIALTSSVGAVAGVVGARSSASTTVASPASKVAPHATGESR